LIGFGGMLGGLLGAIAFSLNIRAFRSNQNALLKYGLTGAVSVAAFVVYFVIAVMISLALNTAR
jgi:ABC-type lipoprotein release transport system permease subunit